METTTDNGQASLLARADDARAGLLRRRQVRGARELSRVLELEEPLEPGRMRHLRDVAGKSVFTTWVEGTGFMVGVDDLAASVWIETALWEEVPIRSLSDLPDALRRDRGQYVLALAASAVAVLLAVLLFYSGAFYD